MRWSIQPRSYANLNGEGYDALVVKSDLDGAAGNDNMFPQLVLKSSGAAAAAPSGELYTKAVGAGGPPEGLGWDGVLWIHLYAHGVPPPQLDHCPS